MAKSVIPMPKKTLPAPAKRRNRWRTLDRLAHHADLIVRRLEQVSKASSEIESIERTLHESIPGRYGELRLPNPNGAVLAPWFMDLLANCREDLAVLDPPDRYESRDVEDEDEDEDVDTRGDLTRQAISERLALLIGAFPAGSPSTPEVYVQDLLEHVAAIDGLTFLALDAACRTLEAEMKFRPSIAEVLKAIREEEELWSERLHAIRCLESWAAALAHDIWEIMPLARIAIAHRGLNEAKNKLSGTVRRRFDLTKELAAKREALGEANQLVWDITVEIEDIADRIEVCDADILEKTAAQQEAEAAVVRAKADAQQDRAAFVGTISGDREDAHA